jgi:type I restriction enzyme R subunit
LKPSKRVPQSLKGQPRLNVEVGVEELDEEKLPELLNLKYHAVSDAVKILGDVKNIRMIYFNFQKNLYSVK